MLINANTSQSIDVMKGILIILVVFAHLLGASIDNSHIKYIYDFIYTFHMPTFIFLSGFLSKNETSIQPEKIIKSILIPFLLFEFLYEGSNYILTGGFSGYIKIGAPYWIMWYLLSLCFWRILSPFILKLRYPLTISVIISLAFQFIDFSSQTLSLLRTFSFLPFYIMGCLSFKNNLHERRIPLLYAIALLLGSVSILALISIKVPTTFLYGVLPYHSFSISILPFVFYKLIGFVAVPALLAATFHFKLTNNFLSGFGKNSLSVYTLHGLFILNIATYLQENTSGITTTLLALFISVMTCYLLSRAFIGNAIKYVIDKVYHYLIK